MKSRLIAIGLGILALCACHSKYNGGEVPTPEEGSVLISQKLSNQRVNAFAEDKYGHIWMATQRGLNRYDGNEFTQYFCTDDTLGLPDNQIGAIHAQQDGRLWVATVNGVAYSTSQGKFHRVPVEDNS